MGGTWLGEMVRPAPGFLLPAVFERPPAEVGCPVELGRPVELGPPAEQMKAPAGRSMHQFALGLSSYVLSQ